MCWLLLAALACAETTNHPADEPPMAAFPLGSQAGMRRVTLGLWKPSFSPDGKKLAVGRADRGIEVVELATGARTRLTQFGIDPAWSPDGRFIAFSDGEEARSVWVVEPTGAQPRRVAAGNFPSWSGDGKLLYFTSRPEGHLYAVPIDDAGAPPKLLFGQLDAWYPAVSPDGSRVAMGIDGELIVIDLASGLEVSRARAGRGGLFVSWSPDGKWLAYGTFRADGVWLYNPDTHERRIVAAGPFTIPTFSPDGKLIAFDQRIRGTKDVWVTDQFDLRPREADDGVEGGVEGGVAGGTVGRPGRGPAWRWRNMRLPELDLRDLDGHLWKVRAIDGKVAFVNVWATWCVPCLKELPFVQKLHDSLKGRADAIVLSLNTDNDPEKARQFVAEHKLTFPVLPAARYVARTAGDAFSIPRSWIVRGGLRARALVPFRPRRAWGRPACRSRAWRAPRSRTRPFATARSFPASSRSRRR
jgi:dipeptidyl aminopeptidase/acylaminoacyl peptidase